MAKISELSDAQLKTALAQYQKQLTQADSEEKQKKLKLFIHHLKTEIQKRAGASEDPGAGPDDSQVKKQKVQKRESQRKSRQKTEKKEERVQRFPLWLGNSVVGLGILLLLPGVAFLVDYYFFEYMYATSGWWKVLIPCGMIISFVGLKLIEADEPVVRGPEKKVVEI